MQNCLARNATALSCKLETKNVICIISYEYLYIFNYATFTLCKSVDMYAIFSTIFYLDYSIEINLFVC